MFSGRYSQSRVCQTYRIFLKQSPRGAARMTGEPIISLHDTHGVVRWISDAPPPATPQEVIGTCPWDWTIEAEKPMVRQLFAACIALGEPHHFIVRVLVHGVPMTLDVRVDPTTGTALPVICRVRVIDRKISLLTERELEVVRLTGTGMSTAEICRRLKISRSSIDTHRSRAKEKLGIKSLAALAIWAHENLS